MNQRKPSPMVCGYQGSSTQFLEFLVRSREILATRMNGKIFQVKISILDSPQKILSLMKFLGAPFCHNYSRSETILALRTYSKFHGQKITEKENFCGFSSSAQCGFLFCPNPPNQVIKYLRAPGQPSVQSPQRPSITVPLAYVDVAHQTAPSAAWVEVHLSYFTPS